MSCDHPGRWRKMPSCGLQYLEECIVIGYLHQYRLAMETEPRKRGRPRTFKLEEKLDRAVEVFWVNGYEDADLDALTEAMSINRPSLYAAFGNKRSLFFQAVERYYEKFAKLDLPRPSSSKTVIIAKLKKQLIELFFGHTSPRGCLIACTLASQASSHDDAKDVLKELILKEEARIEGWAHEVLNDERRDGDARRFSTMLIATLHSTAIKVSAGIPRKDIEREVDATLRYVIDVLQPASLH